MKVLLYLYEHLDEQSDRGEKGEHPVELTAEAMITALGLSHQVIYRAVKQLIDKGHLEKERRFISKTNKRRNFYFLTFEGKVAGHSLRDTVGRIIAKVREGDKVFDASLDDVIERYGKYSNVLDHSVLINNLTKDKVLDIRRILEPMEYIDYSDKRPRLKHFFGRISELKEIEKFIGSEQRVLCIRGLAGVGKTTLMSKAVKDLEMNIFWQRLCEFSTATGLLKRFGEFLARMGRPKLSKYLDTEVFDTEEALIMIGSETEGGRILFVLDNIDKAHRQVVNLIGFLKEMESNMKLVVMGRTIPQFYDRSDVVVTKRIKELDLGGLDKQSGKKLLKQKGVKKDIDRLYEMTKGHPLMLELIQEETSADAEEYFKEEVFNTLDKKERAVLELASVFRYPFLISAAMEIAGPETVDSLIKRSLLHRIDNAYGVHDLIRDFVSQRLSPARKLEYHQLISDYYETQPGDSAFLESMFHDIKGGFIDKALKKAIDNGDRLTGSGPTQEFRNILLLLSGMCEQDEAKAEIILYLGECHQFLGDMNLAVKAYGEARKLAEAIGNKKLVGMAALRSARALQRKSAWKQTLEKCREAILIFLDIEYEKGLAQANLMAGKASWRFGKLDVGARYLDQTLQYCKDNDDIELMGLAYMEMANINIESGKYDHAVELIDKSLSISRETGNIREEMRAYNNLGTTYSFMGDIQRSIEYYEKQLALARKFGYLDLELYGLCNLSTNYIKIGKFDRARDYCDQAYEFGKRYDDKLVISILHTNYGNIFTKEGNYKDAREHLTKALTIAKEIGSLHTISQIYRDMGEMYRLMGEFKRSKENLELSMKHYLELGNETKACEIEKMIEEL